MRGWGEWGVCELRSGGFVWVEGSGWEGGEGVRMGREVRRREGGR